MDDCVTWKLVSGFKNSVQDCVSCWVSPADTPSSVTGALFSLSLTFPSLPVAPEMLLPKWVPGGEFLRRYSFCKGPVDESSPLCKYHRRCVYCLYPNQAQDSLFLSNLISSKWIPNNVQITIQLQSFHMLARLCSKSFKLGFSSTWTKNFCCRSWV